MNFKKRSLLIDDNIPQFIRQEYPNFVEFIKVYYSQQDTEGEAQEFISNSLLYGDVDTTTLEFLENFSSQYLKFLPQGILEDINKTTLIKNIKQFYQSLGTESSVKFLFRLLFNEDVDLYYPTYDILRVSDGTWRDDYIIKISNNGKGDITGLKGCEIVGQTSGARAIVESVQTYTASNGFLVAELILNDISPVNSFNNFQVDEIVTGTTLDGSYTISETVYSILTGVDVTTNDLYNVSGDQIRISSIFGVDGFIAVSSVESGSINSMEIIKAGTGYSEGEVIRFVSATGRDAKAVISSVGGSGEITGIEMVFEGYAYEEMPSYTIESAGTGAILYPVSDTIGKIKKIEINNFGVNYSVIEEPGFPYNFPIQFTFQPSSISFYKTAFIYNDTWNDIQYKNNENIVGQTSGARGIIKRININTGIIAYELETETAFIEGEEIVGEASGAAGYRIHKIFGTEGEIESGAVANYKGYFYDTRGFISGDKYIQDSYYYQDFSYTITTVEDREKWIGPLKELVHPAGSIVFGFSEGEELVSSYSYGGWLGPLLNSIEFYKFLWQPHVYSDWSISDYSNTQISVFEDLKIYEVGYLAPSEYESTYPNGVDGEGLNVLRKTNVCFGSSMRYTYTDAGQSLLIDEINSLLIDTTNTLLI